MEKELKALKKEIEEFKAQLEAASQHGDTSGVDHPQTVSIKDISAQLEYLAGRVSKLQAKLDALKAAGKK